MENKQSSSVAALVFAVAFIIGGWFFYKNISQTIVEEANASKLWPAVEGTVALADISTSISDGTKMYASNIVYKYIVEGKEYSGTRISTVDGSSNSASSAKKDIQKYAAGSSVTVYYDPELPDASLLEPGPNFFTYLITYGPLVFCLIGFLMLWQFVKKIGLFVLALFVGARS
ncbi:DUF3592 domain-containing protein [Labilibaculum euxinus]|uniref:DUF3592 domain-containing protein n=1 Tax=Labilibaculum euxinus TaxID=2686357 RepID=A0A7M4D1C3_9BACT|nr:DUF3592 domain-containing protein [Labilibaculum euxinus]MUP36452.1 DUF3592 domain-containing protein [Labilibaculum euxinus]MVB05657.1 DUF3592 domain-containing protein [Labilibaculum euxinus]